jgi:hypothetical protein
LDPLPVDDVTFFLGQQFRERALGFVDSHTPNER